MIPSLGFDAGLHPIRRWLVVFGEPERPYYWWDRVLTHPGFRHVSLLAYWGTKDCWVHLDWGLDGASCCLLETGAADCYIERVKAMNGIILDWLVPEKRPAQRFLQIQSCVSFAQRICRVEGRFFSPLAFYRRLLYLGATEKFAEPDADVRRRRIIDSPGLPVAAAGSEGHAGDG